MAMLISYLFKDSISLHFAELLLYFRLASILHCVGEECFDRATCWHFEHLHCCVRNVRILCCKVK